MAIGKMENQLRFGLLAYIALFLVLKLPDLDTHRRVCLLVEALLTAPQVGQLVRSLKMGAGSRHLTISPIDGIMPVGRQIMEFI